MDSQEFSPTPQFKSINSLVLSLLYGQSLSHVWLFATPWTAAHQASLSITSSQSLPRLMSIESVMPSNHLILCHPLLLLPLIFPSIRSFPMSQLFSSGGQRIGVSVSTLVLPMNTQDWFPLWWTIFYAAKDGETLHSQQKQNQELTVAQIMNSLLPNSDLNWRK